MHRRALTRQQLRGAGWSEDRITTALRASRLGRVLPATFITDPARLPDEVECFDAAVAHFGPETTAVLSTAARLHGLPTPWPEDGLTHLALPPGREQVQRPGYRIHTGKLADDERTAVSGRLVTTVGRTVADLMCSGDRLSAVAVLDAALAAGLIDHPTALASRARTVRRRGAARSRDWWLDADERAESPLETRVRLRATDGGYRPTDLQRVFRSNGRTIRTDFAWRRPGGRWLVGEADGRSVHDAPEALHADRARSNDLVALGDIDIVRFTWADSVNPYRIPEILGRVLGPPPLESPGDLGGPTEDRREPP